MFYNHFATLSLEILHGKFVFFSIADFECQKIYGNDFHFWFYFFIQEKKRERKVKRVGMF